MGGLHALGVMLAGMVVAVCFRRGVLIQEPDRSRVYANVRGVSSQGQVLAVVANVAQPWPCCQLIGGHMLNLGEI